MHAECAHRQGRWRGPLAESGKVQWVLKRPLRSEWLCLIRSLSSTDAGKMQMDVTRNAVQREVCAEVPTNTSGEPVLASAHATFLDCALNLPDSSLGLALFVGGSCLTNADLGSQTKVTRTTDSSESRRLTDLGRAQQGAHPLSSDNRAGSIQGAHAKILRPCMRLTKTKKPAVSATMR